MTGLQSKWKPEILEFFILFFEMSDHEDGRNCMFDDAGPWCFTPAVLHKCCG